MVLIDTWWNVNRVITPAITSENVVLIDTWWNVNSGFGSPSPGFPSVLIDTWWNVNVDAATFLVYERLMF